MDHTKEPWSINEWTQPDSSIGIGAVGTPMISRVILRDVSINEQKANARRIVACVNWCEGNSTEGMERAVEIGRPYSVERDAAIERELDLKEQVECSTITQKNADGRLEIMIVKMASMKAERDETLAALEQMCSEFRGHDLPYGSAAYNKATSIIRKLGKCYYAPDGTLMNPDGSRSIFDDVDQ